MEQTLASPSESQSQMAPPNQRRRKPLLHIAGGIVGLVLILEARRLLFIPLARVSSFNVPWAGSLAWSPDGSKLAAGINAGDIAIWGVTSMRTTRQLIPLQQFKAYADEVFDLRWSPDGTLLASIDGGEDDTIVLWESDSYGHILLTRIAVPGDLNSVGASVKWVGTTSLATSLSSTCVRLERIPRSCLEQPLC